MYQIISDVDIDQKNLLNDSIKSCIGCFSCWVKTPGKCIYEDDFNQEIIQSKKVIIISKISFGGYSSKVKTLIERNIPLVLPTFKKINKELHHEKRYSNYPEIHVIGYGALSQGEENTFKRQVKAHSINFHAPAYSCTICSKEDIESKLNELVGGQNE